MIKEYIGQGESLEEATAAAIEGLGADDGADVQIEVISEFKKKALGLFGGSLAKVRAYVELPNKKPAKKPAKKQNAPKKEEVKEKKAEEKPLEVQKPEIELFPLDSFSSDSPTVKAAAYVRELLIGLGCEDIVISAAEIDGGTYLQVDGEKLGACIGRHGETLDALQYLTSLAANTTGGYYKVTLNIGDYREKREVSLRGLAIKVSERVKATGRSRTLEPMNPYERRIIHTVVQEIEGVTSNSIGDGANRRVVISAEGGERKGNRDNRSRGGKGGKKPSQTVTVKTENREPKKDSPDIPLYGRLN